MTAKNTKPKPARRTKAATSTQPQERTVTIPFPDTDSEDEANRILAKDVPGWDKLDKDERAELLRLIRDHRKRGTPAKVKLIRKPDGGWSIEPAGKSEMLAVLKLHETFSANSIDPVNARANELLKYLGSVGADNEGRYNAALSFIESMAPRDQAEALLLVQMYCTHDAAIRALSQLGSAEWVPTAQTFGNLATKLLRTSQGQMETLARMRRGGEQVVRHVHVDNRGGQAVIAENVHTGGKGNGKIDDQSHATGTAGIGPALLGADPFGNGVPIPSREGPEAVPYARGHESGSA
ncbi:hypothetical protein [Sphingobium sp. SA916]|uniref:hypothetical protein n=1 Tax=Sphingobium sp. SA916 TaxID=1851207 RepID=UPI000CADC0D8|nr:hypothetical protein [Sphingobium sp. SA916]PNQ02073.1 hypothetical protein A8G00_14675 [Sphingobium sp. SA916]